MEKNEPKIAIPVKETPFDIINREFLASFGALVKETELKRINHLAGAYKIKISYTSVGNAHNFKISGERRNVQKFLNKLKKLNK